MTLPILGNENWVEDPERIMSHLFKLMFIVEYSYSNIFKDRVISVPYLIMRYGGDPLEFKAQMVDALTDLFSRYFTEVNVAFTLIEPPIPTPKDEYDLQITGVMNDIRYGLQESISNDYSEAQSRFTAAMNE